MMPLFVISLVRSVERRRETAAQLAALGIEAVVSDAVDGADLIARDPAMHILSTQPQPHLGRSLSAGEIGCLASHIAVLERIAAAGHRVACVIEDDCLLTDRFRDVIAAVDAAPRPWDVLLLGHHSARHDAARGAETCFAGMDVTSHHRAARVAEFPMGAFAYLVTCDGARQLAGYARPMRMPADWVTGYSPAVGVRLWAVTPPCVMPRRDAATTIDGREGGGGRTRHVVRDRIGRLALFARKAGLRPYGYVRRF